jgi:hypothetical protein
MTTEERFQRIEHLTAGAAEERRKDREEYKALWRETDRRMNDFAAGMVELRRHLDELAVDTRLRFEQVADQMAALGEATDARIAALVSAIGEHVRLGHPQK